MDYNSMYGKAQTIEKNLHDKLTASLETLDRLSADSKDGDLKSVFKNLALMYTQAQEYETLLSGYSSLLESYDKNGDFAK